MEKAVAAAPGSEGRGYTCTCMASLEKGSGHFLQPPDLWQGHPDEDSLSAQVTGLSFTWLELTWNLMGGPSIGLSATSWHIPKSNLQGMPF